MLIHQLGVVNSAQFWYYLPRIFIIFYRLKAQSYKAPHHLTLKLVSSPGYNLCFWLTGYKLEPTTTHSNSGCQFKVQAITCTSDLPAINWWLPWPPLRWLTELREILYLLDYWLIIKGYNSGIAIWKSRKGQVHVGQELPHSPQSFHFPKSPCVHQIRISLNPVVLGFYGDFID